MNFNRLVKLWNSFRIIECNVPERVQKLNDRLRGQDLKPQPLDQVGCTQPLHNKPCHLNQILLQWHYKALHTWIVAVAQRYSTHLESKTCHVMSSNPAKCWAFFSSLYLSEVFGWSGPSMCCKQDFWAYQKNGNFTAQLRVKQAKYANEYFCTLWLNGCGKKALNRCRWSKKGCLRAFREDQRKESTNELKKLFKKWKTSGKHSMNEWMNEWMALPVKLRAPKQRYGASKHPNLLRRFWLTIKSVDHWTTATQSSHHRLWITHLDSLKKGSIAWYYINKIFRPK